MLHQRLNKFLAARGFGSRRACDELIRAGKVMVNSRKARLGEIIDPEKDCIKVENHTPGPRQQTKYLKFYKPRGMLCSVKDPFHSNTLANVLSDYPMRLFPVGRLDKWSEGLLLLCNDGQLAFKLSHPKFGVKKKYLVEINNLLKSTDLTKFERGLSLDDGKTLPCRIKLIKSNLKSSQNNCVYNISIKEGKKRQIRRMMASLGKKVLSLKRIQIGRLKLEDMKSGEIRPLSKHELKLLFDDINGEKRGANLP
ncbi:pseudouridine synthase [Candidatus Riflebacteria bacterium]